MSTYYIPCPVKSAFSSAFTLKGGAEFGNKILYSKFAVTGDAVHLQSAAFVHTHQVRTRTCMSKFQMYTNICQFSALSYVPVQNHPLCWVQKCWCILKVLFLICIPFFWLQSRNRWTPRTLLQVLINRALVSSLYCSANDKLIFLIFYSFCLFWFCPKALWFPDKDLYSIPCFL